MPRDRNSQSQIPGQSARAGERGRTHKLAKRHAPFSMEMYSTEKTELPSGFLEAVHDLQTISASRVVAFKLKVWLKGASDGD